MLTMKTDSPPPKVYGDGGFEPAVLGLTFSSLCCRCMLGRAGLLGGGVLNALPGTYAKFGADCIAAGVEEPMVVDNGKAGGTGAYCFFGGGGKVDSLTGDSPAA